MGGKKKKPAKTHTHRAAGAGGRRLFVAGGHLSDFSPASSSPSRKKKNAPLVPRVSGTTIGYTYPSPSAPDLDSPITISGGPSEAPVIAFVDRNSCPDPPAWIPLYDYDPAVIGGLGLGFRAEEEENEDGEDDEIGESMEINSNPPSDDEEEDKGRRFLSIGGVRVYTEADTSSPEEEGSDDKDSSSSEEEEDASESEESSSSSDDDTEIDEELAQDYIEGIGGSAELMTAGWLAAKNLDEILLKSGSGSGSDGGDAKLGPDALMDASKEYGMMMKAKKRRGKGNVRAGKGGSPAVDIRLSAALDDLMLVKDTRTASGRTRRRQKPPPSQLSQSWPGGKKKHRKELIAMKRRERMINRGVDLDEINLKLKQMVIDEVDMMSFQPMHSRDCSQVQRLAAIYRLRSGCQGSGKQRFVTVMRTGQTCLPSSNDKLRLDKLLGAGVEDDFILVGSDSKTKSFEQAKYRARTGRKINLRSPASHPGEKGHKSAAAKLVKNREARMKWKQGSDKQSSVPYSERPVSFVSYGVMQVDSQRETVTVAVDQAGSAPLAGDQNGNIPCKEPVDSRSSKVGAFEMHTRGFGSKMMAKMGFVEGGGLGKDGRGMAHPIEAIKRPKSLGLGAKS